MHDTYYCQEMIHSANFFTTLVKLSALSVDLKPVDIIGYVKLQFYLILWVQTNCLKRHFIYPKIPLN